MAVTLEDVRRALAPDEPNYDRATSLGPEALPHLATLIESQDPHLAPKATYAAGLLRGVEVVNGASTKRLPSVRVAAAAATRHFLPEQASSILERLVNDEDYGVRKIALRYTPKGATEKLLSQVENLEKSTDDDYLRGLAREALERNR